MNIIVQKQFYPLHNVFRYRFQWHEAKLKIEI